MSKKSYTHYYVQAREEGRMPQRVVHTTNEKTQEHYYKFADRKMAQELLEVEKQSAPNVKFRIVKCTETFESGSWV